ncbi:hypothetical protein HMPREF9194_01723 [Treponema maltophilum ATCC 51939]|uniref:Uncharacterized protein n=1 Tax=Treponema maltophilum ATCC 51939 TaxID=1125699 RepID=S3KGL8_TREMA|nr:hypothetical protein HMPREF9194_01723 [Treponema maltophilum ATCC 51939]
MAACRSVAGGQDVVPLSIPPVPCYTFFMKAARRAQAYILPHKNCIFPKKTLDTKRPRRIMPFDTRYPIPDTRYPIPDTRYPIPDTRYPIPDTRYLHKSSLQSRSLLCFEFRRLRRRNSRIYSFYNSHSNLHSRNCSLFRTNVRTYSAHSVHFFHVYTFGFDRRIR